MASCLHLQKGLRIGTPSILTYSLSVALSFSPAKKKTLRENPWRRLNHDIL